MQAVKSSATTIESNSLTITYEGVAYALLIALALWLRVAELDTVPLSQPEAQQAVAAWRTLHPDMPGSAVIPESPLLLTLHLLTFSLLGASEFSVRILTALAGALLVAIPVLFRDLLGRAQAFLMSLILAFSPVLLVASRMDSPVIWSVGGALVGLWALWQWWTNQQRVYALVATALFSTAVLLTDPAGWVFALILLGAGVAALLWNRIANPDDDPSTTLLERLHGWPVQVSLLTAGLTIFVIATGFVLNMPGLAAVSELLGTGVAGIVSSEVGVPPLFGWLTALFYEPFLWVLGLIGIWMLVRRGALTLLDRFLVAWLVLAGLATVLYQGTSPAHALWFVVPLAALATPLIVTIFQAEDHPFLEVPWWSKPVIALALFALLAIFTINFQVLARSVLTTLGGAIIVERLDGISLVWAAMSLLFIVVGYFLVTSLWGTGASGRGVVLGLLLFMFVTSLGSGWSAAVTNVDDPVEFWHVNLTSRETFLLRQTLLDLTRRETGGFPRLTLFAQVDDGGIMGWLLRDFNHVQYITQPSEGRAQAVVLLPMLAETPDLNGPYVGQNFTIERGWQMNTLQGFDFLAWWMQRRTRTPGLPTSSVVLWLRQDVYDGVSGQDLTQTAN